VTRQWVVNASPLIVLGKLSQIKLLIKLTDTLVIPKAVAQEIEQGKYNDSAKLWLKQEGRDFIRNSPPLDTVIANWDLGDGESHVLNWASINSDYEAVLDDLAARKCAQTLSIPVRGTLGVLLLAKKTGLIPKIEPLLNALSTAGFHIAPNILKTIRNLADE
jgi:predicted nucleic acid-binding protein